MHVQNANTMQYKKTNIKRNKQNTTEYKLKQYKLKVLKVSPLQNDEEL